MCDLQRGNLGPVVEKLLRLIAPERLKQLEAEQVRAARRIVELIKVGRPIQDSWEQLVTDIFSAPTCNSVWGTGEPMVGLNGPLGQVLLPFVLRTPIGYNSGQRYDPNRVRQGSVYLAAHCISGRNRAWAC